MRNEGMLIGASVWLEPFIANYPIHGKDGRIDALLAIHQPPLQLLACHKDNDRVRSVRAGNANQAAWPPIKRPGDMTPPARRPAPGARHVATGRDEGG
jgi:hypothetical protein